MLKVNELRNKSVKELSEQIIELRKEQFNMRMQHGTGSPVKTHRFKAIRKSIAQIKTIMTDLSKEA